MNSNEISYHLAEPCAWSTDVLVWSTFLPFLPPANEVWGKVIFLHQFVILFTEGGACMVAPGGACVVLFGGACMVLFGGAHVWFYFGEHAWFYSGGMCGFIQGGCACFFQFFRIQWDTVNERAVHILLECILVLKISLWRTSVLFVGPLIPLFWTSGNVCPGYKSQDGTLVCALTPTCNGFLRFTSGATTADLLMPGMAAEHFNILSIDWKWDWLHVVLKEDFSSICLTNSPAVGRSINACNPHQFLVSVPGFGWGGVLRHYQPHTDGAEKSSVTNQISSHQFLNGH